MGLVPARRPGWLLEARSNPRPRGMVAYPARGWTEPGLQTLWLILSAYYAFGCNFCSLSAMIMLVFRGDHETASFALVLVVRACIAASG